MPTSLRYAAAVIGAAETDQIGVVPDKSALMLNIESALNAMADAGITKDEIDGIASTMSPTLLAHYLGIVPRWVDGTSVGGTSYLLHVRHAAAAIALGLCNTVLITHMHSDHTIDLGHFLITRWILFNEQPLTLVGPPGLREYVDNLLRLLVK